MSEHTCTYCGSKFSTKYTLANHQKRVKFCLAKQRELNIEVSEDLKECEYCKFKIDPSKYAKHLLACKVKLEHDRKTEIQSYIDTIEEYKKKNQALEIQVANLQGKLGITIEKD